MAIWVTPPDENVVPVFTRATARRLDEVFTRKSKAVGVEAFVMRGLSR